MLDRGLDEHFDMGQRIDIVTAEEKKSRVMLVTGLVLIVILVLIFVWWLAVSFPVVAGVVAWVIFLVCSVILVAQSSRSYKYVRTMRKE